MQRVGNLPWSGARPLRSSERAAASLAGVFRKRSAWRSFLKPGIVDRGVQADAGHDVLQHAAGRAMIEHVIGDDGRARPPARQHCDASAAARASSGKKTPGQGAIGTVAKHRAQPSQFVLQAGRRASSGNRTARSPSCHASTSGQSRWHCPLPARVLPTRQQTAKPAIGCAVGRIHQHRRAALKIKAAADDRDARRSPWRLRARAPCRPRNCGRQHPAP